MNMRVVIGLLHLGTCLLSLRAHTRHTVHALSLEEAVALALAQNPEMAEAQSRLAESEARLRAAKAGGKPILRARVTYDHWTEDQRLFPATRNGEAGVFGPDMLGAELVVTFPLYTGGRVSGETEVADWNRQADANQLTRIREWMVFQVTALYYGLLAQEEVLRSLETAIRALDEQQRTVQALVNAEKAARVDVLRTNVRRAELYERQVRERNNRTVQQQAWAVLLGLEDAVAPEARGALPTNDPPACLESAACIRTALSQRSDIQAAKAAVAAAQAALHVARAGYRPTLSAYASYGLRWMPDARDRPEGTDTFVDVGRAGLMVEIPLFDGHWTDARVAEHQSRLDAAQERLRKLELQIRFEVETALADLAAAKERVRTAQEAIGQAEESFRIMREKYNLGKGTMTDVLDAQAALVAAQTSHARALADLAVADARRKLAIGEIGP